MTHNVQKLYNDINQLLRWSSNHSCLGKVTLNTGYDYCLKCRSEFLNTELV